MPTYIALLRGINIGGQKIIPMATLRAHIESFEATDVQTYIQTGNIIFTHRATDPVTLRRSLEAHWVKKFGCAIPTLVKTARELRAIAGANPYDTKLPDFGRHMYVCFFEKAPLPSAIQSIQPYLSDVEQLIVKGLAGYAFYTNGLGRAKLSSAVIERKLGLATLRNWNTVTALLDMTSG
ncbi:MAG: DUF1697 domain-containing protein [Verrucomicrobiota bacterium]